MRRIPWIAALAGLALLTCWLLFEPAPSASAASGVTLEAQAGLDHFVRAGQWLPVQVTVGNEGAELSGEVQVEARTEGGERVTVTRLLGLPNHARKQVTLYLPHPGATGELDVRFVRQNEVLTAIKANIEILPATSYVTGVVASDPQLLNGLNLGQRIGDQARSAVAHLAIRDLPRKVQGLGTLDVLLFNDVSTGELNPEQMDAIQRWVQSGGQLVIGGGPSWQKVAQNWGALLPLRLDAGQTLPGLPSVGAWADAPLESTSPVVVASGPVTRGGRVLVSEQNVPIVSERQLGQGRVVYVGLDLNLDPVKSWAGQIKFWRRIVAERPTDVLDKRSEPIRNTQLGALGNTLTNIPALELPSTGWLGLFLIAYVLCVGPLNYLALRWLDRRELAWITIPTITLIFSLGAYAFGSGVRGGDVILHTISVERQRLGVNESTVTTYLGLFSPTRRNYDITVGQDSLITPLTLGVNRPTQPTGRIELARTTAAVLQQGDPNLLRDVGIDVWGMQGFVTETRLPLPRETIKADLHVEGDRLKGTITNQGELPLRDTALLLGNAASRLGTIAPGASLPIDLWLGAYATPKSQTVNWSTVLLGDTPPADKLEARERARQVAVLDALFISGRGSRMPNRPLTGFNLLAWTDQAPVDIQIKDLRPATTSTRLLIAELPVSLGQGPILLPPGFTQRSIIDADPIPQGTGKPQPEFELTLDRQTQLQFRLPPMAENVRWQTLYLLAQTTQGNNAAQQPTKATVPKQRNSGANSPSLYLWDWTQSKWVMVGNLSSGENRVDNAQLFVDPNGTVRVLFDPSISYSLNDIGLAARGEHS